MDEEKKRKEQKESRETNHLLEQRGYRMRFRKVNRPGFEELDYPLEMGRSFW